MAGMASDGTPSVYPGLAHLWAAVRLGQLDSGLVQAGHIPIPILLLVVGCPGRQGMREREAEMFSRREGKGSIPPSAQYWRLEPGLCCHRLAKAFRKQSPGQVLVPAVPYAAPSCPRRLREPQRGLEASLGWGCPLLTQSTAPQRDHHRAAEVQGEGGPSVFGIREGTPKLARTQLLPQNSQRADEGAGRAPAPNIFILFVDATLLLAADVIQQLLEGEGLGPGDVDRAIIFGGHQRHQDELVQGVRVPVLLGQEPAVPAQRVQLEGPPEVLGETLPGQVLLQL